MKNRMGIQLIDNKRKQEPAVSKGKISPVPAPPTHTQKVAYQERGLSNLQEYKEKELNYLNCLPKKIALVLVFGLVSTT